MLSPWILTQVLGCGECALALIFLRSCATNKINIRSVLHSPTLFLVAWLAASAIALAAFGPEHALLAVGLGGGIVGALCHPAFAISLLMG